MDTDQDGGTYCEIELNNNSVINLTGNVLGDVDGGTSNRIDINGGTFNISGNTGIDIDIDLTTGTSSIDLRGDSSTLDVKNGDIKVVNNGTQNFAINSNAGEVLVAGLVTLNNKARDLILNMNNGAKLDIKGGWLNVWNNGATNTGDVNIDFNSADVDVRDEIRVMTASPSGDDVMFDILGSSTVDCGVMQLEQRDGNGAGSLFTTNFRGTSVINCTDFLVVDISSGTYQNIFGGDAVMNISGTVLIRPTSLGGTYSFLSRNNAEVNIPNTVTINKTGGTNAVFASEDFADVNVGRLILNKSGGLDFNLNVRDTSTMDFDQDISLFNNGGAEDVRVRTYGEGKLTITNDLFMTNNGGKDNEVETNNSSTFTVGGNLSMNVNGGENLLLDQNGTSNLIIDGGTGLTWNIFNSTATSSISGSAGSSLTIKGKADLNHQDVVGMQTFTWSNNGGSVTIGGDLDYSSSGGNDATFTFNQGSKLDVGGNVILMANNLSDDLAFTCDSCDFDVASAMTVIGTNGTDATRVNFTGKATVDIVGDLTMDKRTGVESLHINIAGNVRGGATVNVANINMNNYASTGGLNLFVQGNNADHSKSAIVTTGDVSIFSRSWNFPTRFIMEEAGKLTADNLSLDYDLAGASYVELEMSEESKLILTGDLNMDATAAGGVRIDLNNGSNLCLAGNVVRPNDFGASQVAQRSTITYNGTSQQTFTSYDLGAGDLFAHANVVLNNPAGLVMEPNEDGAWITDTMTFTDGIVTSADSSDHPIFVGARAWATGASNISHVSGPVRKDGPAAFNFPTGKDGRVGMIGISDPGNQGDFTAEYFRGVPVDHLNHGPNLQNISVLEYWDLNKNSGNSSVYVTLYFDRADSAGIESFADLRVAHYTGGIGKDEWKSGVTGGDSGAASGSVTTANSISTFSPFTFGSNTFYVNPLPVELLNFSAALVETNVAKVQWATANEENNSRFEVMRSFNSTDFTSIETVKGAGTTSQNQSYSILDNNLSEISAKYVYYKLKQVDFDGKVSYSKVIALPLTNNTISSGAIVASVTPNPYKENLTITLNNTYTEASPVSIKIVDAYGREVNSSTITSTRGLTATKVNMAEYAAGVYYVIVTENGRTNTIKTVKQ